MPIDFIKLPSNKNVTVWHSPSGGSTLGITDVDEPLAAELNNTGGTSGAINATEAISWNDYDFGMQASETTNEPSLADSASFEEFGANNFGGSISYFRPRDLSASGLLNDVHDLTKAKDATIDAAVRIDGETASTVPAANGDMVSVYRVESSSQQNPFTPGESKRRTVGWVQKSDFAYYTVVGDHTITAIPPATTPWLSGRKGRIRASQQGREVTNRLRFSSSNSAVAEVQDGGFYSISTGAAARTATITITDEGTGDTATVSVVTTA